MKFFAMERKAFLEYAKARQAVLSLGLDPKAIMDMFGGGEDEPNDEGPGYTLDDTGAAHIPVSGVLCKAADWVDKYLSEAYGAPPPCTYQAIATAAAKADSDPAVTKIIFDVDSPGGDVDGVDKAAQAVAALEKPCEARVDYMAASAAFWLSSQCDTIVCTSPVASVGSIGVLMVLYDWSKAMDDIGIKEVVITSTDGPDKYPDIGTDEGIATLRKELDSIHQIFAERVASGRRCSIEKVNTEFGKGALVFARDAVKVGMVDALNETIGPFTPPDEDFGDQGDNPDRDNLGQIGAVGAAAAEGAESQGGEGNMPEKIELTPEALAAATKNATEAERARINALDAIVDADPGNEKLAQIVKEAKATGLSAADISVRIQVAIRDFVKGATALPAGVENPPKVHTTEVRGAGGEDPKDPGSWSDETIKAKGKSLADSIRGTAGSLLETTMDVRIRG